MKKLSTTIPVTKKILKKTALFGVLLLAITQLLFVEPAGAAANNKNNIPAWIINHLRDTRQQNMNAANVTNPPSNKWCDPGTNKYRNFVYSWLSPADTHLANQEHEIEIGQSTNSVDLLYNATAGGCDAIFNSAGAYVETNLRETRVNIVSAQASVVGRSTSLTTPGLDSETNLHLDYSRSYSERLRFVKSATDRPAYKQFRISGLSSLPANQTYTIRVVVRDFMVHRFANGGYRCVNGDKPVNDFEDNSGCSIPSSTLTLKIKVLPRYTGRCEFIGLPARVGIGDSFTTQFRVYNDGANRWDTRFVGLASRDPYDNTTWGTSRVSINGSGVSGSPPGISSGGSTLTTEKSFTAPTTPGIYLFSWRVIQENKRDPSTGQLYPSPPFPGVVDNIARCSQTVTVYENRNYPYVRGTTGDIWTGMLFRPNATQQCTAYTTGVRYSNVPAPRTRAGSARIRTHTLNSLNVLEGQHAGFEKAHVFIARLYKAVLGANRSFDVNGVNYWINQYLYVRNENNLTAAFLNEPESLNYGLGKYPNTTQGHTDFVRNLYLNLFGYEPAVGDLNFWVAEITSGRRSRPNVVRYFIYTGDSAPFAIDNFYNYGGSGSDYGVFSTGLNNTQANDFTGMIGGNGNRVAAADESLLYDLTFASSAVDSNGSGYGSFSSTGQCLDNYFIQYDSGTTSITSNTPATTRTTLMNATGERRFKRTGDLTLGTSTTGITIGSGANIVLLVDGDVSIENNITYSTSYGSTASPAVPRLVLIARGNISISKNVSRLDGIYIAQPNLLTPSCTSNCDYASTSTGRILTCHQTEWNNSRTAGSNCGERQLKVNGSLIAHELHLYRTYGSIGSTVGANTGNLASSACSALKDFFSTNYASFVSLYSTRAPGTVNQCAAEWVDAHPERYLTNLIRPSGDAAQAFQELPPIY